MAKERDELLDHDYDGILEYDNPLPRWWLWLFYGTIAFAVLYVPYYLLGYGPSSAEMYRQQMAELRAMRPEPAAPAEGGLAALVRDEDAVREGRQVFTTNCVACHGAQGQGGIGPNLTDPYWLHGNAPQQVIGTIGEGVLEKGMPAWKTVLKPEQIRKVAAYLVTLQGSEPPDAKAPQGDEVGWMTAQPGGGTSQ